MEVRIPGTGRLLGAVACFAPEQTADTVSMAAAAQGAWADTPPAARGAVLRRWGDLMLAHQRDLATIMVLEQGKPLAEAMGEVAYAAGFLHWFAAEASRAYGATIPSHLPGSSLSVRLRPVGVVLAITPWNFPSAMITRKAGAALAAGCAVIVKPAEETPFSALALAVLAEEAGLPPGTFSVVPGHGRALIPALLSDARIRAVSFTGSTAVGRRVMALAAATVKRVGLELGGHAPFIVLDEADLDRAVADAVAAKFTTGGQDCLAANRIFVQRPLHDAFCQRFTAAAAALRVGHGLEPDVDIGPVTTPRVAETCAAHVADALAGGARLLLGGGPHPLGPDWVAPTVLADVTDNMRVANEETFGPVAAILPFDTDAEVLARANASEYGLAAYVQGRDITRVQRLAERLDYGMVGVNTARFTGAPVPFGGVKQSGLGREGGTAGIHEFLEPHYLCVSTAG